MIIKNLTILAIGIAIGLGINISNIQVPQIENNIDIKKEKVAITPPIQKQQTTTKSDKKTTIKKQSVAESKSKEKLTMNSFSQFKSLLLTHKYTQALALYEEKSNNDTIENYQTALFDFIEKEISKDNLNVENLIKPFLQLEYENPEALYYLAQIKYKQQKYKLSIQTLYKIKESYANDKLKQKVTKELDNSITSYLNLLSKQKNIEKQLNFLLFLLEKEPENVKYKYSLAKLYYDLKQYEKAQLLFEEIASNELYQNKISEYLNTINKKMKIKEKFTQKIALEKKDNHFFIDAVINESIRVKLLIDTGATLTLIDRTVFKDLNTKNLKTINLNTANGTVRANLTKVKSFAINDLSFNNFEITVSNLNSGFDGLLGMNYLKNFDFYIDQEDAILYLNPL